MADKFSGVGGFRTNFFIRRFLLQEDRGLDPTRSDVLFGSVVVLQEMKKEVRISQGKRRELYSGLSSM